MTNHDRGVDVELLAPEIEALRDAAQRYARAVDAGTGAISGAGLDLEAVEVRGNVRGARGSRRGRFRPRPCPRPRRRLTTASEHEELQDAAAYVGMPMSTWIRAVVLERARALAAEKEAARKRDKQ